MLDDPAHTRRVTQVGLDPEERLSERADRLGRFVRRRLMVDADDVRAGFREANRDRAAEAGGGAGDKRFSPGETEWPTRHLHHDSAAGFGWLVSGCTVGAHGTLEEPSKRSEEHTSETQSLMR